MRFFWSKSTAQMEIEKNPTETHSFCETVTAGSATPWHIRHLTSIGKKLSGGADTLALCGATVSWDLRTPISAFTTLNRIACKECAARFTRGE